MTGHAPVIGLGGMKVMRRTKVPCDPKPMVGFYGKLSSSDVLVLNIRRALWRREQFHAGTEMVKWIALVLISGAAVAVFLAYPSIDEDANSACHALEKKGNCLGSQRGGRDGIC
jgi:hypothetical protein